MTLHELGRWILEQPAIEVILAGAVILAVAVFLAAMILHKPRK